MTPCNYIWPSFITNIFPKNQPEGASGTGAFRRRWHVLYIIHEHRIKQTTPALLWPFTNMKSQIKPSTNHSSVFQLPPDLLFPERRCLKVMAAFQYCILSRMLCSWPFAVTWRDATDPYAKPSSAMLKMDTNTHRLRGRTLLVCYDLLHHQQNKSRLLFWQDAHTFISPKSAQEKPTSGPVIHGAFHTTCLPELWQASHWYHPDEPWCSLLTVWIQMTCPLGPGSPPTRRKTLIFGQAKA